MFNDTLSLNYMFRPERM